jgi:hypothetical protein
MLSNNSLAAMVPSLSPYHFGFNNPVRYNDPLGLMGQDAGMWGTGNAHSSNASKNPLGGFTGPGSGNHWSDGMGYSDWFMWGGSQMYKDGLASGAFEFGGKFFHLVGDGNRVQYEERNGKLGYWVDSEMNVIDYVLMNNKLFKITTPGVRSTFYEVGGNSLKIASIGFNFSLIFGVGIEFGGIEDGKNSSAFLTVKYLEGIDISGYIEGGTVSSITNERVNAKNLQGPGSEISIGVLLYSYTFGGDGYLTNRNSLNPLLFRSSSHSLGIGLDVSRTDASTYTWTFEPVKTPEYIKLKMGGV